MSTYLVHSEFDDGFHDDELVRYSDALAQFEAAIDLGASVVWFYRPGDLYASKVYVRDDES